MKYLHWTCIGIQSLCFAINCEVATATIVSGEPDYWVLAKAFGWMMLASFFIMQDKKALKQLEERGK